MSRQLSCSALIFCLGLSLSVARADWPRFRGPNGTGVSSEDRVPPTSWSPSEKISWKSPLPGPGVSSPIVIGDRVFVTCWSGYGLDRRNPGNIADLKRHLVCLDRKSGEILWDKKIDAVLPEDPYSGAGVPTHGYASHTPVSDGERVYVFFGKTGALAFDLEGNQLWQTKVGSESDPRRWGSSSSPILFENVLIVTASAESEALVGLDTKTGKEIWKAEAAGLANTWGTPALSKVNDTRTELVIAVPYEVWGLDPATGKFHWYAEVPSSDQANSSILTEGGVAYSISGGRGGGGSSAVKAGGKDEVTDSNILWKGRASGRFGTPVLHEGRIYSISSTLASCMDAKTGNVIYEERIASPRSSDSGNQGGRRGGFGGSDYTSPVIAGDAIYYVKGSGETIVLKTGDKFEQVGTNRITEENERFMASPAISDGALFIRSDRNIYCISEK